MYNERRHKDHGSIVEVTTYLKVKFIHGDVMVISKFTHCMCLEFVPTFALPVCCIGVSKDYDLNRSPFTILRTAFFLQMFSRLVGE